MFLVLGAFSRAEAGTFKGDYFNDINLSPAYRSSYTSNDGTINFDWGSSGPQPNSGSPGYMNSTNYSVRWTGWIDCPTSGTYTFEVRSDDGARLYLDNSSTALINDWSGHPATTSSASVSLVQGAHRLRLEYFQGPAPYASISLRWRIPSYQPDGANPPPLVPATDAPSKIWSVETALSGGGWVTPVGAGNTTGTFSNPFVLEENQLLPFEFGQVTDVDRWRLGAVETDTAPGTITYNTQLLNSQGEFPGTLTSPSPRTGSYKSPTLNENQPFRRVSVSMFAYDTDTLGAGETGVRHDANNSGGQFEVLVRQKVWTENGAIGYKPDPLGGSLDPAMGAIPDGRLISPVDTRNTSPKPAYAAPGGIVTCQIETATDYDSLTYYPDYNKDVVTPIPDANYVWTTTSGTFRVQNADNTYSYPTSVTGKKAYFVAPAATGGATVTATVKCTISDPFVVVKPDSGDRTDVPLIRTQQIIVPSNTVELGMLVSSAPALGDGSKPEQFATRTTLGGTVYPTAYVTVGQGMRVASNFGTLRLEELPDAAFTAAQQHSFETNHIDFYLCFYQAGGWEKFYDPDGTGPKQLDWWTSPEAPQSANSAAGPVRYRYRFSWNSGQLTPTPYVFPNQPTSTLLGHNGAHRLSYLCSDVDPSKPQLAFTSNYGGSYLDGTPPLGLLVSNLVLTGVATNNGTSDYFKFARESGDVSLSQPTISFTIEDQGDPHGYSWRVRVRGTDQDQDPEGVLITGVASAPGQVTVKINDPGAVGQTQEGYDTAHYEGNGVYTPITTYGTYTFDISVLEQDGWGNHLDDVQSYRSIKAFLPYYFTDASGQQVRGHSGNLVTGTDGIERYSVNYYIYDASAPAGSSATSFGVQMLPPGMAAPVASSTDSWVKTLNTPVKDVLLQTFTTPRKPGTYIIPFTAVDNHAIEYRDHKNKPLLAKNDRIKGTPDLVTTYRKDRVVSAMWGRNATGGGRVDLSLTAGGNKQLSLSVERKAGDTTTTLLTYTVGVRAKAGKFGNAQVAPAVVAADGTVKPGVGAPSIDLVLDAVKGTAKSFFILGVDASNESRSVELVVKDDAGNEVLYTINSGLSPGQVGNVDDKNWDFTVFWVEAKAYVSGNIDSVLPSSVKSGAGEGAHIKDDPVQDILSEYYKGQSGVNTLGFSEQQRIEQVNGGPRLLGGIAFSGQIRPSGMNKDDFNNIHSRFNSFNWGRKLDVRQYDENGNLRASDKSIYQVASDNRDDDPDDNSEDLVPDSDGKPNELFIWAIDVPSLSWQTARNSGAITLRKRFFFRQFARYAGIDVSKTVSWYWRVSGKAEVLIDNATGNEVLNLTRADDFAGDNQLNSTDLAIPGNSAYDPKFLTSDLQSSTTGTISLDPVNPVMPTSLSVSQGSTPGSIKGVNMVSTTFSLLAYLIAEYETDTETKKSVIIFNPTTLQPDGSALGNFVPQGATTSAPLHTLKVFNKDKVATKKDAVLVTP